MRHRLLAHQALRLVRAIDERSPQPMWEIEMISVVVYEIDDLFGLPRLRLPSQRTRHRVE